MRFFSASHAYSLNGAIVGMELPSFFLECLQAQTTCTAPADKLLEVISLKASTCCQLSLLIYIRSWALRGEYCWAFCLSARFLCFCLEWYWGLAYASAAAVCKMGRSPRNATSECCISGNTEVLIFWMLPCFLLSYICCILWSALKSGQFPSVIPCSNSFGRCSYRTVLGTIPWAGAQCLMGTKWCRMLNSVLHLIFSLKLWLGEHL